MHFNEKVSIYRRVPVKRKIQEIEGRISITTGAEEHGGSRLYRAPEPALREPMAIGIGKTLLPGYAGRELEVYAIVVIHFTGGGEVEIGQQDFLGSAIGEVKECIAHNRVVQHVGLVAVFENEHGRRLSSHGLFGG